MEALLVIDRLVVGPVLIQPKKLTMPYQVVQQGETFKNELVYTYEEAVFEPENPLHLNMASLIGGQVALNYGLFCKEIIFDGLFESADRQFLLSNLDNTSKEIYVNKFLKPNPFLLGEAANLPIIKKKKYTQAKVRFTNSAYAKKTLDWQLTDKERSRVCVLSSGGKDSLLSYGLMKELNHEVYPIYVNESGRHWFTALNAYRYQKQVEPNTGRVWSNCDRMYNWMLRRLPFVRQDFANVRADDYPIRLWTVAVFLFGVIPLMHKHKMGRLVIGDEYDATQKSTFEGITDYNGLYDQSHFFDEAMSHFFMKKGWGISQFSVLRSASELLILKALVKRYPVLQSKQVSCHATHEEDKVIKPCGKCEKCRRIVGMLTALGEDPKRCGYTEAQIANCLDGFDKKKVKQLGPEAEHLSYLLQQKGAITTEKQYNAHPFVTKLRFDRERSLPEHLPNDLRLGIFSLLMEYADGALIKEKGKWQPIDPLTSEVFDKPFPYEFEATEKGATQTKESNAKTGYRWGEFTWPEMEERLSVEPVAILPTGAIEQHGHHLPLDVDAFDANYLAEKVAAACSDPKPLVLPVIPFGVSYHHNDFKGTISIRNEVLSSFVYDIGTSLFRNGIRKLLIINGHGDNAPTLLYAAQMLNRDTGMVVLVDTGESSDTDIAALTETEEDLHAGEVETSTALALRPHLVKMDLAADNTIDMKSNYFSFTSSRGVPWYIRTKLLSETGVMGDATKGTAEKGQKIWEVMIAHLVNVVEELKRFKLEEQ